MKLVISSSWHPISCASYLYRAALRAGHEILCVGPSTCSEQPWEIPLYFPSLAIKPAVAHDNGPGQDAAARWCDLWIDVDSGWALQRKIPASVRVGVVTDPHVPGDLWSGSLSRPWTDITFVMQSPYVQRGDKWLPWAYDPEWFRPRDVERTHDVTNLGAPYEVRMEITAAMEKAGLRVLGPGRTCAGEAHAVELCRAPVAIVWPLADDLPARVFEARASHRTVLTRNGRDLQRTGMVDFAFHLRDYDLPRLVEFAQGLVRLSDDMAPHDRTAPHPDVVARQLARHTWDARLQQLIEGRDEP